MSKTIRFKVLEDNTKYSEVGKFARRDISEMELLGQFGTAEIATSVAYVYFPDLSN